MEEVRSRVWDRKAGKAEERRIVHHVFEVFPGGTPEKGGESEMRRFELRWSP